MVFQVGILGIDGSGKSTLVTGLEKRLSPLYRTLSVGQRITLSEKNGPSIDLLKPLQASASPLDHFFRNVQRHLALQRLSQLFNKHQPEICLEDRDPVIDLCTLLTAYFPLLCYISPSTRVQIFSFLTRQHLADMYIHLQISPDIADARITEKLLQTRRCRSFHETPLRLTRVAGELRKFTIFLATQNVPALVLDALHPPETLLDQAESSIIQHHRKTSSFQSQNEIRNNQQRTMYHAS